MMRRALIGLAVLAVLGAGVLLIFRSRSHVDPSANSGAAGAREQVIPRTSEALIADALKAGDLTYEESLLQRAYAIFDDPRLAPLFRSPVPDWEAASTLLLEVDAKEATLSADLLSALAPFRARPNDPISIINRPRSDIVKTRLQLPQVPHDSAIGWIGRAVAGTNLRIWIKGSPVDLDPYEPLFRQVWAAFPDFFRYPDDDDVGPDLATNPDGAIDFYLINGNEVDPRVDFCYAANSNPVWCAIGRTSGVTIPAPPRSGRKTSAYVLLNRSVLDEVELIDNIAHELTHVSQNGYDAEEDWWLKDSTASWVGYKVVKKLGRDPRPSYDRAAKLFRELHLPLNRITPTLNQYNSWLFFFYASNELGNGIVQEVWRHAESGAVNDVQAVDRAIPFEKHFPGFTVLNWNEDEPGPEYKDWDRTFRPNLGPDPINVLPLNLGMVTLDEPLPRLAANYYHYAAFGDEVRRITLQNFYATVPNVHVWAIKKIGADWKPAEDWSRNTNVVLCRDLPAENVTELVLVVSNSHLTQPVDQGIPKPRVISEDVGCETVDGTAKATLRLKDDAQDVTYISSRAPLRFRPRTVQDQTGNVQYDLMPTSVTWRVSGRKNDCTVSGETIATIPSRIDQPLDPSLPAYGYLNVVAKDGGDFHSVQVSAVNPAAMLTKTCPGDPPVVTKEPFGVQWLLNVLSQPNTHIGNAVLFRGTQNFDPARIQNNLPMSPGSALSGLLDSPGRGFITPEIQRQLKEAQASLDRIAAESGGKVVYTFEWELQPPGAGAP